MCRDFTPVDSNGEWINLSAMMLKGLSAAVGAILLLTAGLGKWSLVLAAVPMAVGLTLATVHYTRRASLSHGHVREWNGRRG